MFKLVITIILATFILQAGAQNALPDFSVDNLGKNRTRIFWANPFGDGLIQLNVQASYDSVRYFRTIFSSPSPQLPENGYVDSKGVPGVMYYRIFYVLPGGAYYFTKSKTINTGFASATDIQNMDPNAVITVRDDNTIVAHLQPEEFKKFRDSIVSKTKDSLFAINSTEVLLKYYKPVYYYQSSQYVVINPEGFAEIKLPDAKTKKYKIIFFDTDGSRLFIINKISDTDLVMDKTNFLHAGWFFFELYENDKLIEKNKIFLQNDF